jgi:hypothetical protein
VSASIDLLRLNARLLKVSAIPTGFSVAVLDREGKFLLRSIEPEKWIGQPGPDVGPGMDVVQWEGNERMVVSLTAVMEPPMFGVMEPVTGG